MSKDLWGGHILYQFSNFEKGVPSPENRPDTPCYCHDHTYRLVSSTIKTMILIVMKIYKKRCMNIDKYDSKCQIENLSRAVSYHRKSHIGSRPLIYILLVIVLTVAPFILFSIHANRRGKHNNSQISMGDSSLRRPHDMTSGLPVNPLNISIAVSLLVLFWLLRYSQWLRMKYYWQSCRWNNNALFSDGQLAFHHIFKRWQRLEPNFGRQMNDILCHFQKNPQVELTLKLKHLAFHIPRRVGWSFIVVHQNCKLKVRTFSFENA